LLFLQGKPYLKKVLKGSPANLDQLEEMFRGNTVDVITTFVPGGDYGEGLRNMVRNRDMKVLKQERTMYKHLEVQVAKRERGPFLVVPALVTAQ
jgi:hypothetical protein